MAYKDSNGWIYIVGLCGIIFIIYWLWYTVTEHINSRSNKIANDIYELKKYELYQQVNNYKEQVQIDINNQREQLVNQVSTYKKQVQIDINNQRKQLL